jgi:hypothetical protein
MHHGDEMSSLGSEGCASQGMLLGIAALGSPMYFLSGVVVEHGHPLQLLLALMQKAHYAPEWTQHTENKIIGELVLLVAPRRRSHGRRDYLF